MTARIPRNLTNFIFCFINFAKLKEIIRKKETEGKYRKCSAIILLIGIIPETGSIIIKNHRREKRKILFFLHNRIEIKTDNIIKNINSNTHLLKNEVMIRGSLEKIMSFGNEIIEIYWKNTFVNVNILIKRFEAYRLLVL